MFKTLYETINKCVNYMNEIKRDSKSNGCVASVRLSESDTSSGRKCIYVNVLNLVWNDLVISTNK